MLDRNFQGYKSSIIFGDLDTTLFESELVHWMGIYDIGLNYWNVPINSIKVKGNNSNILSSSTKYAVFSLSDPFFRFPRGFVFINFRGTKKSTPYN